MESETVQYRMDKDYLWKWSVVEGDGTVITVSNESYLWLADAKRAVQRFVTAIRLK
jgi:hypothetical protein